MPVNILAIETSADETSAALMRNGKLASNVIYSQMLQHRKTGGIVPEVAARAHIPKIVPAIKLALAKAGAQLSDIDAMAVTIGPGLITSLMVGVDTAKTLAFALEKPIIAVNHLEGHLLSALHNSPNPSYLKRGTPPLKVRGGREGLFPALGLIVSGGHTMLVLVRDIGKYKILGETLDDAAGEAFDKIAKILGLPYPGGPALAKLAEKGNPKAFDLPRPMLNQKNYNFSFAGLKTAVLYLYGDVIAIRREAEKQSQRDRHVRLRRTRDDKLRADISASAQQAIVDVLVEKTLLAAKEYKAKSILLGGGVAANKKLQQSLKRAIQKNIPHSKFYIPHSTLTTDNAGMIALAAYYHYVYGNTTTFDRIKAESNLKLASWR